MGIETGTAMIIGAVVAGAAAGASVYESEKQRSATKKAAKQQEEQAKATAQREAQATRKAESNQADTSALLQRNVDSASSGGTTLLTGAQGVDTNTLSLSKQSSLG